MTRGLVGPQSAAAAAAPAYLPTAALTPAGVWGSQRMVGSYAGPLFRLARASDGATLDAEQVGDFPDYDAIATWIGTSVATVTTWYDQTGNGHHKLAGSLGAPGAVNSPPLFNPTVKRGNVSPILFQGTPTAIAIAQAGETAKEARTLAADIALDSQAITYLAVVQPISSERSHGIVTFSLADFGTGKLDMQHGKRFTYAIIGSANSASGIIPAAPDVYGVRTSPSSVDVYSRGVGAATARTLLPAPIEEMTTGYYASVGFMARSKYFCEVVYDGTLDDADMISVISALKTAYTIPTTYDYRWVLSGDSIEEGTGCKFLQSPAEKVIVTREAEIFNTAVHGKTLASRYAERASIWSPYYTAAYGAGKCIITIQEGTNDLNGGATAASLYAILTDSVAYLQGLGFRVGVMTILKNDSLTTAEEMERQSYNDLIIANTAGADAVADPASDPAFSSPTDAIYYVDGVHMTDVGNGVRAIYLRALAADLLGESP